MTDARSRLTELSVDPFTALSVHFGMLLGVSDIELLAANPRGKLRLHNAWLHGPGVVWGWRVSFDPESRELAVDPGLAQDAGGRELSLANRQCLDLDSWYQANRDRLGRDDGTLLLDVVVRYRACLDRPVPALAGECDDSPESAYSRVKETVQIALEPAVDHVPSTFLRLRRALGTAPGDPGPGDLAALVAADSLDLVPAEPADDAAVVVARLTLTVVQAKPDLVADGIDHSVRHVLLPTLLVTELLGHYAPTGAHLDVEDVRWDDDQHVSVAAANPLYPATLAGNVAAHRWDPGVGAWVALTTAPTFLDGRLVVDLGETIAPGTTVRIVVSAGGLAASGPTPVTADVDGKPVALAADVVLTLERS